MPPIVRQERCIGQVSPGYSGIFLQNCGAGRENLTNLSWAGCYFLSRNSLTASITICRSSSLLISGTPLCSSGL